MIKTDLAIIGGGPAGLSAALFFGRLKRPVILFDSGMYRNEYTSSSHTIPGFDGVDPAKYRERVRGDLEKYGWVSVRDMKVVDVRALHVEEGMPGGVDSMGDMEVNHNEYEEGGEVMPVKGRSGFVLKGEDGIEVQARKVILATGIQDHLPSIPGLAETWGKKAIHCVFCDGTETSPSPLAFLITRETSNFNSQIIASAIKLWSSLNNPSVTFLTNGLDLANPEDLEASGLERFLPLISSKKGWGVVESVIERVEEVEGGLEVHFGPVNDGSMSSLTVSDREEGGGEGGKGEVGDRVNASEGGEPNVLKVGHIVVFPSRFFPNDHATPILAKLIKNLTPFGTIPPAPTPNTPNIPKTSTNGDTRPMPSDKPALPMRMGDDPKTEVPGLFWAGNSGSFLANVNVSVAQGQAAGAAAAEELGQEDMEDMESSRM